MENLLHLSNEELTVMVRRGEFAAEELERRSIANMNAVKTTKVAHGHFRFEHNGKHYEAKNVAYMKRYRVWELIQGTRGLKRGEVLMQECVMGINWIRSAIGNGSVRGGEIVTTINNISHDEARVVNGLELITYSNQHNEQVRFRQYAKDEVPAWATNLRLDHQ